MVIKYSHAFRGSNNLRVETTEKGSIKLKVVGEEIKGVRGISVGQQHVKDDYSVRRRDELLRKNKMGRPHLTNDLTSSLSELPDYFLVVKKTKNGRDIVFEDYGEKFEKEKDTGETVVETRRIGVSINMCSENPLRLKVGSVSEDVIETLPSAGREGLNETAPKHFSQPIQQLPQPDGTSGSGVLQKVHSTPPTEEFNRTKVIRRVHAIARELYGDVPMNDDGEIVPSYVYYTRRLSFKLFGKKKRRELSDEEWNTLLNHLLALYEDYVRLKYGKEG